MSNSFKEASKTVPTASFTLAVDKKNQSRNKRHTCAELTSPQSVYEL